MKAKVYSQSGEVIKEMTLSSDFELTSSENKYTEYLNYVRANMRSSVASTLDRSEVRGGGKKPWQQKGTGRARHGSSRSPIWVGGGVTFGPSKDQNFKLRMNKKTRAKYLNTIFSYFAKEGKLLILDKIKLTNFKTKEAEHVVEKLGIEGKISLILGSSEKEVSRAFRNLPYIVLLNKSFLDIPNLVSSDYLIITSLAYTELINNSEGE